MGRAQHKAARCHKSDWKYNSGGCGARKKLQGQQPLRAEISLSKKSTLVGQHECI